MKLLLLAPLAVAAGVFGRPPLQDPMAETQIETIHVAGPVHMLVGYGGNIGVSVGEDGILMIDDQFADMEKKIRAAIQELQEGSPRWLVNTHWHGDHTGGNAAFSKDALIFAHDNVRARMSTGGGRGPASVKEALPVITFGEGIKMHVNGETVHAVHYANAHTDGDTALFFEKSNVLHTGDLFFHGMYPFVDLQSGGTLDGVISAVETILKSLPEGAKIIPGHGPLTDRSGLQEYRKMLKVSAELMRKRIEAGMDESAAVAEGMPEEYAAWAWSFVSEERWLQTVYRSLTAE